MKTKLIILMLLVSLITVAQKTKWADDIKNPANAEFLTEVAFNKGIKTSQVTQAMFNERYLTAHNIDLHSKTPIVIHKPIWDSTTNVTYVENNKSYKVYITKNNKTYTSRISKNGNYYRKYIKL